MISYTHIRDPKGPRFQQLEKDPTPVWATDIRTENMTDKEKTKDLLSQAKKALYDASCIMSSVTINNEYQQKAYHDVLNAWHAIDKHQSSQDLT